jgi:GNAT superfamily N-acetyltransferase
VADDVRIVEDHHGSAVAAPLIRALHREGEERYGAPDLEPDAITNQTFAAEGGGAFYVAWCGKAEVGCGALRRYDAVTAEVKRMYVKPEMRRRGIARSMLRVLEARATSLGYKRLVLETGTKQPEAIALYESEGWAITEPYGAYKDEPTSRCFAKDL